MITEDFTMDKSYFKGLYVLIQSSQDPYKIRAFIILSIQYDFNDTVPSWILILLTIKIKILRNFNISCHNI